MHSSSPHRCSNLKMRDEILNCHQRFESKISDSMLRMFALLFVLCLESASPRSVYAPAMRTTLAWSEVGGAFRPTLAGMGGRGAHNPLQLITKPWFSLQLINLKPWFTLSHQCGLRRPRWRGPLEWSPSGVCVINRVALQCAPHDDDSAPEENRGEGEREGGGSWSKKQLLTDSEREIADARALLGCQVCI